MQLFDEIVALLSEDNGSLASALLKTRVLMHRIGHIELNDWIKSELNGYERHSELPDYRIVGGQLVGTVENIARRYTKVDLPTLHLTDDMRTAFCTGRLGHSVAELEAFAKAEEGSVACPVPPEFYGLLGAAYPNAHVTNARTVIGTSQIVGVLVEIRSRLLEFVLNLQDKIGDTPEKDLKKAAEGIDTRGLLNSAIFGANTTIIVGSQNTTTVSNTIKVGDRRHLQNTLREAGVDQADLEALDRAIDDDGNSPRHTKSFGPRVGEWVGNMIQKAATGVWQIGIGTAGNLLATAISSYYGHTGG